MDNRITRTRLHNFLSYEWIMMIIVCAVAIFVWEFAYTVGAVRLTVGQHFKFYYDQSIYAVDGGDLYGLADNAMSYDVLKLDSETLTSDYNVLSVRLSIQEGDILITDSVEPAETDTDKNVRAKLNIDSYKMYSLTDLLKDAKDYLKQFLKDGVTGVDSELDYNNLDGAKIEKYFLERMKSDNRFRSAEDKKNGVDLEKGRISQLVKEVSDFSIFLSKYEQTYLNMADTDKNKQTYKELYEKQEQKIYGINAEFLKCSSPDPTKSDPSSFFQVRKYVDNSDMVTAKDVVIMVFDFYKEQPHLQFETISFLNAIIRECSDFIPA